MPLVKVSVDVPSYKKVQRRTHFLNYSLNFHVRNDCTWKWFIIQKYSLNIHDIYNYNTYVTRGELINKLVYKYYLNAIASI